MTTPDDAPEAVVDAAKALGPITKITANYIASAVAALNAAAEQTGDSQTDTLNRAIQLYARVIQAHNEGRGRGRFRIRGDAGGPIVVEVNRPWWRFW